MKLHTLLRLACLAALFSMAMHASAQPAVKCESNNGGRVYCGAYTPNQVTMNKQISGAQCVRGSTWGVDNRGLWVDKGCRATFYITGNRQPGGYPGGGGGYPPPPPGGGGGGWNHPRPGGDQWPPSGNWNGGNWGHGGACFYKDSNFRGEYICLRRGESRPTIGMNDRISSIRVFGGARVTFYIDANFSGQRGNTPADIANLSGWRVPGTNHSWNDHISSIRVQ
jgi:Protein of unknown function (DUF3011)/Peptidase inhibitor family I36